MQMRPKPLRHRGVTPSLSRGRLLLRHANVAEEGEFIHHGLVRLDIEEHGGASPMLGEHNGLTGLLDLLDELRCVRAKFGDGLNIPTRLELWHRNSEKELYQYRIAYRKFRPNTSPTNGMTA